MSLGPDYSEERLGPGTGGIEALVVDPGGRTAANPIERQGMRAAGQLVVRSVITRAITLLGTIALARILTAADFGVFAVVVFMVTILTVVGDLGFGAGLVQQREEPTQADLETVFAIQLLLFGGLGLGAAIIGPLLALALDLGPGSAQLALLIALSLLPVAVRGVPFVMLTRTLRFGPLALSEVVQQIVFFGLAVGCALAGLGAVSFGVAALANSIVASIFVWAVWRHRPPVPRIDRSVAARLWHFGIRAQGSHIAAWAKDSVVPLFGGLAGGTTAIGYLQFAWRNGQLISVLDEIVTRVGFPAFSRLQHDRSRFQRAGSLAMELTVLGAVGIQAWLIATAAVMIPLIFSAQWTPAVEAFQLVALGAVATLMTAVIRTALNGSGASAIAFRGALFGLASMLVLFPLGVIVGGVTGGGAAFLASAVVTLAVNVSLSRSRVSIDWFALARIGAIGLVAGTLAAAISMARPDLVGLAVSGLAYVAIFGLLAVAFERRVLSIAWRALAPAPRPEASAGSREAL